MRLHVCKHGKSALLLKYNANATQCSAMQYYTVQDVLRMDSRRYGILILGQTFKQSRRISSFEMFIRNKVC